MNQSDLDCYRTNYDKKAWEEITEGWTKCNVVPGAILAVNALCDEVERLRAAIRETLDENGHLADGPVCTLSELKRALNIQTCRKCGGDMKPGLAMGQTVTGMPDFIGGEVCTVSPGGPGKLIECSKCEECGWSVAA